MTVTASSGSPRVSPQLFDTLPLSRVRQAEQQDRFPDGGELDNLITFFRSGQDRLQAAQIIAANAEPIVARAANRIFVGGTPLSFLESPLSTGETARSQTTQTTQLASDQAASNNRFAPSPVKAATRTAREISSRDCSMERAGTRTSVW